MAVSTQQTLENEAAQPADRNSDGARIANNWLGTIGICDGQWFIGSKLKLKAGMKARCLGEAGRIWCCLGLHTECFQRELAVKLLHGRTKLLQPVDIATETGIKKQNIRRGLLQLKACGLADIDGTKHHNVKISAWVKPRSLPEREVIARDYLNTIPIEFRSLFSRFKIQPTEGFEFTPEYCSEIVVASREYLKSQDVLKAVLGRARGRDPIQSNGKDLDNPSAADSAPANFPAPTPAEDEGCRALVASRMAEVAGHADDEAVTQLIQTCRESAPDCTDSEILCAIEMKVPSARKANNPIGFLLTVVPKLFMGSGLQRMRQSLQTTSATDTVGGQESAAERQYREAMERRTPKPWRP